MSSSLCAHIVHFSRGLFGRPSPTSAGNRYSTYQPRILTDSDMRSGSVGKARLCAAATSWRLTGRWSGLRPVWFSHRDQHFPRQDRTKVSMCNLKRDRMRRHVLSPCDSTVGLRGGCPSPACAIALSRHISEEEVTEPGAGAAHPATNSNKSAQHSDQLFSLLSKPY